MTSEEALDEDDADDDLDEGDEDLDEDDEDLDDEEDLDEKTGIFSVERLSSVDTWEMYRLVDQDTGLPITSIAISTPQDGEQAVDYAVWRVGDLEEPGLAGSLVCVTEKGAPAMTWADEERENVIRQVLHLYERELGVEPDKADFQLSAPEDSGDEEDFENES